MTAGRGEQYQMSSITATKNCIQLTRNPKPQRLSRALQRLGHAIDHLPVWVFRRYHQLAIDAVLSAFSIYLAYQLRFDFDVPPRHAMVMWSLVMLLALVRPLSLLALGSYDGIWRFFNLNDAIALLLGSLPILLAMIGVRRALADAHTLSGLPISVVLIDFGVFLSLAYAVRGTRRTLYERARNPVQQMRTLLIGQEVSLATALRQVSLLPDVQVVGLLTEDHRLLGLRMAGFPVIGSPAALAQRLASGQIDLVLIADSTPDVIGEVVETAMNFGVEARLLPSAAHVIHGDVRVSNKLKPELVLSTRTPTGEPHPAVVESFRGRVVLITGAGGSIGSEVCRQVVRLPISRAILLDHEENSIFEIGGELASKRPKCELVPIVGDIRNIDRIRSLFGQFKPNIVLHAAAYKHVPIMEYNCAEAVENNIFGTRILVEAAVDFDAERFLMISTDKAVNPTSIMGATKRGAEMLVQDVARRQNGRSRPTNCACVRFGNVMGSRGSVAQIFAKQIDQGGPVTVTHADMTRYFMTIPEAVQLVLQASTLGSIGEIYMLDMGDPVKITSFARKLIEMSGQRPDADVEIRFVGARPGEKIQEQLWADAAEVVHTAFPRVLRVEPPPVPANFMELIDELKVIAQQQCSDEAIRNKLLEMPIGYRQPPLSTSQASIA